MSPVDADTLETLIAATPLAGREIVSVAVPGMSPPALVQPLGREVLDDWRWARTLLDQTGRWPLAVALWNRPLATFAETVEDAELFARFEFEHGPPGLAQDPETLKERARIVDVAAWVQAAIDEDPDLLSDDGDDGQSADPSHLQWFSPDEPAALVWLPVDRGPLALSLLSFFGAAGRDAAPYIAMLQHWKGTFGAELVAHYGTMLQFVVGRPPRDLETARALAAEQLAVAPCTTIGPGVTFSHHARALLGRSSWFLHERP